MDQLAINPELKSRPNMSARLVNGDIESYVAIPSGLTFIQVTQWLEERGYTNQYWTLNGIYQFS